MSVDDGGSFLTELDHAVLAGRGKRHKDDRLVQSRRDHKKLMEVVNAFGEKVGGMIDSQRTEFMTAYEHHMIDVQRELQSLREKVATIESAATLSSKLDSLDAAQKRYKEEALYLDSETLDLRKRLRKLVGILHSVEKERDWYLQRLRDAKKEHNALLEERAELGGEGLDTTSIYSGSNNSQYTLLIERNSGTTVGDLKARLKNVYGVSRDQALLSTLPHILSAATLQPLREEAEVARDGPSLLNSTRGGATIGKRAARSKADKRALGELVALKARREALREFVSNCASSCDKGPWSRIPRRPVHELLAACAEVADDPDSEAREEERLILAFELAGLPETYFAIADLLSAATANNRIGVGAQQKQQQGQKGDDASDFSKGFFADGEGEGEGEGVCGNEKPEAIVESNQAQAQAELFDEDVLNYLSAITLHNPAALQEGLSEGDEFLDWD